MKNNLSWNTYFMVIAKATALRSKDPNTKVGAIITNELNQIIGTGYNGFPRGISDEVFPWSNTNQEWEDNKYPYVAHAELNAILSSKHDLLNSIVYVTLFPCNECAKLIIQSGIRKIYYLDEYLNNSKQSMVSKKMLDFVGINYIKLDEYNIDINISKK